jgi:5-methyltetrahydrofolate--homocysteine methyltransferase
VKEGSHALDICTAFVGRDELSDMTEVITRLRGQVNAPLVFDSTETPVLDAALKLYGGKAIINSINFEDGEEAAATRLEMARRHGAAVIALTIDEDGMAKTADKKLEIAQRLYDFAVNTHGLDPADLMFDPLTFTICTGNADDRRLGIETLEGIRLIREALPDCQIILGLSNTSGTETCPRIRVTTSVMSDSSLRPTKAVQMSSAWLPSFTWSRAMAMVPSQSSASCSSRNFLEPLALQRSPMDRMAFSWRSSTRP